MPFIQLVDFQYLGVFEHCANVRNRYNDRPHLLVGDLDGDGGAFAGGGVDEGGAAGEAGGGGGVLGAGAAFEAGGAVGVESLGVVADSDLQLDGRPDEADIDVGG